MVGSMDFYTDSGGKCHCGSTIYKYIVDIDPKGTFVTVFCFGCRDTDGARVGLDVDELSAAKLSAAHRAGGFKWL
jgi:hypothetical protein